ncbi:hypothetical protein LINGRAHAP2_LOCUS14166, partial [Linum grandiflorum]
CQPAINTNLHSIPFHSIPTLFHSTISTPSLTLIQLPPLQNMWHLLFAAAAAAVLGSTGLAAKRLLLNHNADDDVVTQRSQEKAPTATADDTGGGSNWKREEMFRFSSSGNSTGKKCRSRFRKKLGLSSRRLKYGDSDGECNIQKESGELEVMSQRRRAGVCLKKRRTAKTVSFKADSSVKDSSLFGWGLGVGMMCMMSAGQVEIHKLSAAMEETSKVVNELKSELDKKKFSQVAACRQLVGEPVGNGTSSGVSGSSNTKSSGLSMVEDAECPSSILTGEPDMSVLEIDQLEAELESELQKLPLTANVNANFAKGKISSSSGIRYELEDNSAEAQGVVPSELDKKLCHVLIQQQGSQIVELESELYFAQEKLQEKEAELRALKDCVKRLTDFSVSNVSGTFS